MMPATMPFIFTTIGAVGTMVLILPAALTLVNLALSTSGRWSLLFGTGPLAFAAVAAAFLFAVGMLEAIGALHTVNGLVGGTDWERGVFLWAAFGTFTFAALALGEHALPRLLRRAWGGGVLSAAQLWLVFGGVTLAGLALMGGGMAEGSLRAQAASPEAIADGLLGYVVTAFAGMGLAAAGALATLVNLFLAYTSGRPADYVVPGTSATAPAGH